MDSTRNSLLEALKQVERRTEFGASGWRLLFYAIVLIPGSVGFVAWTMAPLGTIASPSLDSRVVVALVLSSLLLVVYALL
ncbi:MAG: hypothetical protein M3R04_04920, partial [bacterium]|nr:hypothetical protein [bacterium]